MRASVTDGARYPVPAARHRREQTIDRSRFICTVERVEAATDAQRFLHEMEEEFPDATHRCWAYLIGPPGSTDRIGMSDAGEPHGTAGRPMLTVLQHSGVGDIAAIVTRYYGGTKLGTGGLVKAYSGTVQLALATMPRGERVEYAEMTVVAGYENIDAILQLIKRFEADTLAEDYGIRVTLRLRVPLAGRAEFEGALRDATRGQIELIDSGPARGYL